MKKLIEIEVDEFEEGNICYECNMEGCEGYPHDDNRCYVKRWMDERPTVDAVPVVHGHWIKATGMMPPEYCGKHVCSECDSFAPNRFNSMHEWLSDICPHCGAKMSE